MANQILLLLAGLLLLVGGGEALVRGASALAGRLGVPPIVIGLTVVAFGTSAPELAVSVTAAFAGTAGIAFGNVVGSNIANIGLLLGLTALARPLVVHSQVVAREIPMMLLASAAALALAADALLDGGSDLLSHGDGIVLLLLFGVFLYYTVQDVLRQKRSDSLDAATADATGHETRPGLVTSIALGAAGLVGLVFGGQWLVAGAVAIARDLEVPDVVIGATIVAVGTSLPELVTCLIAARKGMSDLAVGNVVGSNLFNLLLVLGTTATLRPVPLPAGGLVDLCVMGAFSIVLLPIAVTNQRTITRTEGVVLLTGWIGYAVWQAMRETG